jgi:hypothetical protein
MLHRMGLAVQVGSISQTNGEGDKVEADGNYLWWNKPAQHRAPLLKVDDPGEAFWRLKDFMRQILAVPKKKIDRKLARKKAKRRKK